MKNNIKIFIVLLLTFVFSGCSLLPGGTSGTGTGSGTPTSGGTLKSVDYGKTWNFKNKAGEKSDISSINILSVAINPAKIENVLLGTEDKGLLFTEDGGDTWKKSSLTATKVYGISFAGGKGENVYASGVVDKKGKIFKSDNSGAEWKEIYSEPAAGTVVTSVLGSRVDSNIVYAGTSEGMIFKSIDGGSSWKNLYQADGPVTKIAFDGSSESNMYFLVFGKDILVTKDQGKTLKGVFAQSDKTKKAEVLSLAIDNKKSGVFYAGTDNGIFRGEEMGNNFSELNALSSSINFPVRAIAVNPNNSDNIVYGAAQAIYVSFDGGNNWTTYQFGGSKFVQDITFDLYDLGVTYSILREAK